MYLSVRRYKALDAVDEILRRVDEGFSPIIRDAPGFISYDVVADGEVVVSVSVFADRAGAEESGRMAAAWVKDNLAAMLSPLDTTAGEVRIHHTGV